MADLPLKVLLGEPMQVNRVRAQQLNQKQPPPLRLLSLDGGGVRGYSMIMIIQELMFKLFVEMHGRTPRLEEIPRPCDHFDLIGGTGTGGLIALLIGRLRLDLETCKEVYVKMTKKVFETDKTIAGLPYRKTFFKASRLEGAIKEVVRDSTVRTVNLYIDPKTKSAQIRRAKTFESFNSSSHGRQSNWGSWGNENTLLFDSHHKKCKTFLTAVYKGSDDMTPPALLRTYDSAHGTSPASHCTIWEAGRATCATYPAFKGIQIGQINFLDEGSGRYSPVAQVLEEALVHEWPGREVGLLVSVGSGKASEGDPKRGTSAIISASPLGKFAEAKGKHIAKVMDCEDIHQEVLEGLHRTGVKQENYIRLNVETGMTDFGINEWSRIADISAGTLTYLGRLDVQTITHTAAAKLAQVFCAVRIDSKRDLDRELPNLPTDSSSASDSDPEDEEVRKHFEQLQRIALKIQA